MNVEDIKQKIIDLKSKRQAAGYMGDLEDARLLDEEISKLEQKLYNSQAK